MDAAPERRAEPLADLEHLREHIGALGVVGHRGRRRTRQQEMGIATVELLGERFGATDLGELRTRIGLSSAPLAERVPGREKALDVVVTAAYGVVGRFRERYEDSDVERAHALLRRVGLGAFTDRRFGTLSEGERKRVLLARALMTDPELMLLDEPAAGLDLGGREDLVRRLGELAGDLAAPALVLVTHHVEEVPPNFTDVLLMREGRVVAQGPIEITLTA